MDKLQDIMPATLTFGDVNKVQGLGVLPILNDAAPNIISPLATLDEAQGDVTIREMDDPVVGFLKIENNGNKAVLILDGEGFIRAGLQDRMLNATLLLLSKTSVKAAVSCIERNRWRTHSQDSRNFDHSKALFGASGRAVHKQGVTENLRREGVAISRQGEVWKTVQKSHEKHGVLSRTGAYQDVLECVSERIEGLVRNIRPVKNQIGSIFLDHKGVIGAEILATPDLFSKSFEKIVRSFALDVLSAPPLNGVSAEPVKQWWRNVLGVRFSKHKSVGVGEDIRIEDHNFIGSGLMWNGSLVHFSCLPQIKQDGNRPNTRRSSIRERQRNMRSSIQD